MSENILAVNLVIKQIKAVVRLCLRFQIQLSLKHPDLEWCFQAHRQSPHLASSQAHQKRGSFPPPALPGFFGTSDPLRLPPRPATLLAALELRSPPKAGLPQLPRSPF